MAYIQKEWKSKEKITANALNNIENGISSVDTEKQDKTDNALLTTDKTVVGAINEINNKIGTGQTTDLSNYYDKATIDTKLSEKQPIEDSDLQTTSKNITAAINEIKSMVDTKISSEQLNNYQLKTDDSLETTSKEVIGSINELNTQLEELRTNTNILFKNLVYGAQELTGGHFNQNGTVNQDSNFRRRFIPVKVGEKYRMKGSSLNVMTGFVAYFDERKRPIASLSSGGNWSGVTTGENGIQYRETQQAIPESVHYIGISYNHSAGHGRNLMVWNARVNPNPNDYIENYCYY